MRNAIPKPSGNTRQLLSNVPTLGACTMRSELLIGPSSERISQKRNLKTPGMKTQTMPSRICTWVTSRCGINASRRLYDSCLAQRGQPNMSQVYVLRGKCYQGLKEPEKAKAEFLAA